MPEYRRRWVPGGTYFFTLVTYERKPLLATPAAISLFRQAVAAERRCHPFEIDAAAVLPDHSHAVWTLPPDDCDYAKRIGRIKAAFTKALRASGVAVGNGDQRGYADVWQPRYWEHVIRDRDDYNRHLDYIHYNPVKHGYVACPHLWEYSSFAKWVRNDGYAPDWCCACDGRIVELPDFGDIAARIGE